MRILSLLAVIVCSLLIGAELVRRQRLGRDILAQACELCLFMQSCVRYEQTAPDVILRSFGKKSVLAADTLISIDSGADFHSAWKKALEKHKSILDCEEYSLVLSMVDDLGRTDISGETMRLSHVYRRLDELHRKRCAELEAKTRTCISVSLLAGVFIAIMLY